MGFLTEMRIRLSPTLAVLLLLGALLPAGAGGASLAPQGLQTAVADGYGYDLPELQRAFARTRAAGTSAVRVYVSWRQIAPKGSARPSGFDPRNPGDPQYTWTWPDNIVRTATAAGLAPIISIDDAPEWAQVGPQPSVFSRGVRPNARDFGEFATALATRYSGRFAGLPRVRYFQALNEPNLQGFLWPQYDTPWEQPVTARSKPVSPDAYAELVNPFADAVHAVRRDNLVVAGGLAPFGRFLARDQGVMPLVFMRQMLCLTSRDRPRRNCNRRLRFDVWSMHPFTGGDARHRASVPGNVSLGNLSEMRRTLLAAVASGHVRPTGGIRFWITEFAWNTNPPFSRGVPLNLHARWVAEALYESWRQGVSLFTWFQFRDEPTYEFGFHQQSGLYFRCAQGMGCDTPKPSFTALRFPFVAYRAGRAVSFWGRTPFGRPATLRIEQRRGAGWRRLATVRANRYGIFTGRVTTAASGDLRARAGGESALPFSLRRPRDRVIDPPL